MPDCLAQLTYLIQFWVRLHRRYMKQKIGELVKNNSCSLAPVSQEACSSLAFPHLVSPHSSHPLKLLATQPT